MDEFLDSHNGNTLVRAIANTIAKHLLGRSQLPKIMLRYEDMRSNFDRTTYDEWDKADNNKVWKFSSGVTPYHDFDDTTNVPIPISLDEIKKISDHAVTSLDLPTWFNLASSKLRIMLLSQDPMPRSRWYKDCREAICSSPFGLHVKSWREKGNGGARMWGLVKKLVENNIGIYLTDIRKFYFRKPDDVKSYIPPTSQIEQLYRSLLLQEIQIVKPDLIVTFGNQSNSALSELMGQSEGILVLNLPHFSGQAQGKIKEYFNIAPEHKFTVKEQIDEYVKIILKNI